MAPRTVLHPAGVKVIAQVTKEKTRKISEDTGPAAKARRGEEKRGLVVRKGTEIKIEKNVQGVVIDPALQDQNQKVEVLTRNRGNPKAVGTGEDVMMMTALIKVKIARNLKR